MARASSSSSSSTWNDSRTWPGDLHFWLSASPSGSAEVDFLLAGRDEPVPVEVKSGASGSLKSLHQFLWRADLDRGIRLCSGPYEEQRSRVRMPDGELDYRLLSLPLYLAEHVPVG